MKVVFRQNLGLIDGNKHDLDAKKCQMGMDAEVSKEVAEVLISAGVAVDVKNADDDPLLASWKEEQLKKGEVKAIAKPAAITAPANHDK